MKIFPLQTNLEVTFVRLGPIDLIENDVTPAHGQPPPPRHKLAPNNLPLPKENEWNFFDKEVEIFSPKVDQNSNTEKTEDMQTS